MTEVKNESERIWALRFSESEWWDGGVSKISSDSSFVALNHTTDITDAATFSSREILKDAVAMFDDKLLNISSTTITENMIVDVTSYIRGNPVFTPWRDEQCDLIHHNSKIAHIQFELMNYYVYIYNPGKIPEKILLDGDTHKEIQLMALEAISQYCEQEIQRLTEIATPTTQLLNFIKATTNWKENEE